MRVVQKNVRIKKLITQMLWLLPGILFYALFRLSFLWPQLTESVYSRGIFRVISQFISTATGWLPFSLGEFLLYAFALFVLLHLIFMIVHAILAGKAWWYILLRRIIALLGVASVIYAVFIGLWGFNYARQPLGDSLRLDTSPATVHELYDTCKALVHEANALRSLVPEDDNGVFSPADSKRDIMDNVSLYYNKAATLSGFDWLSGSFGRAKPVLYSTGLSYAHISGVYFPFTGEANVNADIPMLYFAASVVHEAAHQRGFAREDEANFLAYYVGYFSGDPSIRYSGTMLALSHSMSMLYRADTSLYFDVRDLYSEGLVRDISNNVAYWQQFESPISETAKEVNNTFLKANMQEDGVKSYGRMVDLLIGFWRAGGINTNLYKYDKM